MISRDAMFRSLADPTRRSLFEMLCREGELPVSELTKGASISQPAVSKHLGILRDAGLITRRPDGRNTYYEAKPETLEAMADWMGEMRGFWAHRLDSLEELLDRLDQ